MFVFITRFFVASFAVASWLFASIVLGQEHLGEPASFQTAISFPFEDARAEDFNHDGHLDLLVFGRGDFSILLGDGHGGFGAPSLVSFGHLVRAIDLADFDADGHLDALVVREGNSSDDTLLILHGAGDGTFGSPVLLAELGRRTHSLLACDLDGDGDVDVATANRLDMAVFRNDGGSLSLAYDFDLLSTLRRPLGKSDFNNDGHVDLVCGDRGAERIAVFLADGLGGFEDAMFHDAGTGAVGLAVADFDGDDIDDVVVTSESREYAILRGDGAGGFMHVAAVDTDSRNGRVIAADQDGDLDADFVTLNPVHNTVAVHRNDGTGDFALPTYFSAGMDAAAITAGDFDEDGMLDIAITGRPEKALVLLNDGAGGFDTARGVIIPDEVRSIALPDMNQDGRLDFAVVGTGDTLVVFLQAANGEFVKSFEGAGPVGRLVLEAGDLNGDGSADLVTATQGSVGRISVLAGDGAGGIVPGDFFPAPFGVDSIVMGNFTTETDDHLDIAVGLYDAPGVTVFEGDGTGEFKRGATAEFELPNSSLSAADLDADGHLDLVSNRGCVRFGNGFGVFPELVDLDSDATHVAIGDLNLDGHPDIVLGQQSLLTAYLGDGARGFGAGLSFSHGVSLRELALEDIDGDGWLDVVLADDDRVIVVLGDGAGGFGESADVPTSDDVRGMATGDIDRDGLADIAVVGDRSELATIHLNRSAFYSCRTGTVNAGIGPIEDVLFVNGGAGYGAARKVVVDLDEPLEISMAAAPADASSVYALYAYLALPANTSARVMPFNVGRSCRATPVTDMSPAKLKRIWNNTGKSALGEAGLPSNGAPETTLHLPDGVGFEVAFFIQGIISDSGSAGTKPGSMTNGVAVIAK